MGLTGGSAVSSGTALAASRWALICADQLRAPVASTSASGSSATLRLEGEGGEWPLPSALTIAWRNEKTAAFTRVTIRRTACSHILSVSTVVASPSPTWVSSMRHHAR